MFAGPAVLWAGRVTCSGSAAFFLQGLVNMDTDSVLWFCNQVQTAVVDSKCQELLALLSKARSKVCLFHTSDPDHIDQFEIVCP